MWCVACGEDVKPGTASALYRDAALGWVHVVAREKTTCDTHTTEGTQLAFVDKELSAKLVSEPDLSKSALLPADVALDPDSVPVVNAVLFDTGGATNRREKPVKNEAEESSDG